MAYIFNYIADIAQKYLIPRYYKGPELFTTSTEMITYLAEILENPFEA
jgi:replication fork clamp-binding protein CrfC